MVVTYDASIPLRQLEETHDEEKIRKYLMSYGTNCVISDVGLASYLTPPQLVKSEQAKTYLIGI